MSSNFGDSTYCKHCGKVGAITIVINPAMPEGQFIVTNVPFSLTVDFKPRWKK